MITKEQSVSSAQTFRALSEDECGRIITEKLTDPDLEDLYAEISRDAVRSFVRDMLENGRFERFSEFAVLRKRSFAILHSTGSDCELLFLLDEMEPDVPIQLMQMGSSDPFVVFRETMTFHMGDVGSEKLQKTLHQYFVTYGEQDYEEDEDDEDDGTGSYFDDDDWPVTDEDTHMAQTAIMLSRVYGEDKVIQLLERVNSGDNISALEFLKIIQSGTEPLADAPLSWSAELA